MKIFSILLLTLLISSEYSLAQQEPSTLSGIQQIENQTELVNDNSNESLESVPLLPIPMQVPPPRPLRIEGTEVDYAYGAFQRGFHLTALKLATEEALDGNHAAQALLGEIYQSGQAVPRDLDKAREWYEIAAYNGNPQAAHRLGIFYLNGLGGLEQDSKQAYDYFTFASDQGDITAKLRLGLLYLAGEGVPRDYEKAEELIEFVALKNNPVAQYSLGAALFDGEFGVPDQERGMQWLKKAAENDYADAQEKYGINLYHGNGAVANKQKGAQWLLKAANSGNLVAMIEVAQIYRIGEGLDINAIEAAKWYIISNLHNVKIPNIDLKATLELATFVESLSDEEQAEAKKRAREWIN